MLSGDGLSSQSYLRSIQKTFRDAEVGITVYVVRIPEGTPVEAVLERIALLNSDPSRAASWCCIPRPDSRLKKSEGSLMPSSGTKISMA